jgi:hypothetical protein
MLNVKKIFVPVIIFLHLIIQTSAFAGEQEDKITKLMMGVFDQPNNRLKVNPVIVEGDYAIAGWSQGDKGGRALLVSTNGKWSIQLCAGDSLKDEKFLKESGVDVKIISSILKKLATEEAKLDAITLKRFSEFK